MRIDIYIATQTLDLSDDDGRLLRRYPVSTAEKGCGERKGSYQTPRGRHRIRARIGAGQPLNAVFRARRPTGEVFDAELDRLHPQRDWILSRILWLCGAEPGLNRLGEVDTMRRYIYIHGTPERGPFGPPASHGCIRMHNADVVELFDRVAAGTPVEIHPDAFNQQPSPGVLRFLPADWSADGAVLARLRSQVFVEEQGVPVELELDEFDAVSAHWLARAPCGGVIGTVRLLPDGHVGRLAVARPWRGIGVGRRLLELAIGHARGRGAREVELNAQLAALSFYEKLGFVASGPVFDDAGIPHRRMILRLY